jgi:hypothetical protein
MTLTISQLFATFVETCWNVLPIVVIILGFQFLIIRKPIPNPGKILIGIIYVVLGITFFLEGLQLALFPLGKLMAVQLTAPEFIGMQFAPETINWRTYAWVYAFSASIGFSTALAEPSL